MRSSPRQALRPRGSFTTRARPPSRGPIAVSSGGPLRCRCRGRLRRDRLATFRRPDRDLAWLERAGPRAAGALRFNSTRRAAYLCAQAARPAHDLTSVETFEDARARASRIRPRNGRRPPEGAGSSLDLIAAAIVVAASIPAHALRTHRRCLLVERPRLLRCARPPQFPPSARRTGARPRCAGAAGGRNASTARKRWCRCLVGPDCAGRTPSATRR